MANGRLLLCTLPTADLMFTFPKLPQGFIADLYSSILAGSIGVVTQKFMDT